MKEVAGRVFYTALVYSIKITQLKTSGKIYENS